MICRVNLALLLVLPLLSCGQPTNNAQLPLSNGPFDPNVSAFGIPAIEERAGQLVLPATTGKGQLLVQVSASQSWQRVAGAVRASAASADRAILIAVRDASGTRRYVRLPAYSRITEPIGDLSGADITGNEHVIYLSRDASGATVHEHMGATVAANQLGVSITEVYDKLGNLFFPAQEGPNKQQFPVWLHADQNVTVQDLIEAVSSVQSAGFQTTLLYFD